MIIERCSSTENIHMMEAMPNCIEHCMVGTGTLLFLLPGLAYAFIANHPHLGIIFILLASGMAVSGEQDINPCAEETYTQIDLDASQVEEVGKAFDTQGKI